MFSFSTIITHPKVFIFRNWESFGNICIRSQSFLFAQTGEVVWVATFELKLNRDFKQRQNRPMQPIMKLGEIVPVKFFAILFSEISFVTSFEKKYQGSREAYSSHFQRWRSLRPSPCVWVGTLRDLERIDYFFSFQYHAMWISPNPNVKPLKACNTCKTLSLWQTSSAVCISSQSCQGPQSDEMMQRSTSFKWKQVLVWPYLESQTALPWNWGWRPCLRNTLRGQGDIACPNFQSCHNWSVHLVSPVCRSQSRNVKLF